MVSFVAIVEGTVLLNIYTGFTSCAVSVLDCTVIRILFPRCPVHPGLGNFPLSCDLRVVYITSIDITEVPKLHVRVIMKWAHPVWS